MIRFAPNCKLNVNGQCSKLRVKCLESRFMDIGGVEFGHCTIRESVPFPPVPKGAKVPGSNSPPPGPRPPVRNPGPEATVSMDRERKAREALVAMGLDKQCRNCMARHMFAGAEAAENSGDFNGAFVLRKMAESCLTGCCGAEL